MQANETQKPKRTSNACIPCRQSKIKCSGNEPCANCRRRSVRCQFAGGNKVVGLEYPHDLQNHQQASRNPSQQARQRCVLTGNKRSNAVAFGLDTESREPPSLPPANAPAIQPTNSAPIICTSPFTLPSTTIVNTHKNRRNWVWLAPSSTWSFTARLSLMMAEKLKLGGSPYNAPNLVEKEIYPLRWKTGSAADRAPDLSGLPSLEDARYLFNTAKFHLGQVYRLFDERGFIANMEEFYQNNVAMEKASECRLWFVQFLLVLAFGRAFLSRSKNSWDPPGSKFFARAMSLMPDHASLWKDSLLAIDVLALASLYLYSIDHRESAHVYVCQAIRIAQLEGLHTQLPEDQLGTDTVTRCRNLWWSLYIIDRHFSSSLGLPMTTHDSDITTLLEPPGTGPQDPTLGLQVRLSRLLSFILTTVYKSESTQLGQFLELTRFILHALAGHAQEIERIVHVNLQNSVERMSRGTRHITLLYHQCVIMATRPLLLSLLMELLNLDQEQKDWKTVLAHTRSLISTGIKSATKTLQILSDEDSILEVFLPFDLEFLYGAAIHLMMANAIFPDMADSQPCDEGGAAAHAIFEEMIYKGNRVAEARKAELTHLETLFYELSLRIKQQGLRTLSFFETVEEAQAESEIVPREGEQPQPQEYQQQEMQQGGAGGDVATCPAETDTTEMPLPIVRDYSQPPGNAEFLDNIGISADDFLYIVDQMGSQDYNSLGFFDC